MSLRASDDAAGTGHGTAYLHVRPVVAFLDDVETAGTLRDLCRESLATPPRVLGGGLDAALAHHEQIGDAQTLLVDIAASLMPTVDIAALRTVLPDTMRIVTLGEADTGGAGEELLAAGADRHLVKPLSAETLAEELFAAPQRAPERDVAPPPRRPRDTAPEPRPEIRPETRRETSPEPGPRLTADAAAPERGRRIVVLGAHAGVGATSLAVNLAALQARDGVGETLLLDLDLQFGTALLMLNRQPTEALCHMLREPGRIDPVLLRHASQEAGPNLSVLGAEEALNPMEPIGAAAVATLLDEAALAFGDVVVDLPAHRLELLAPCLATASDIVLVSDFTLAGVRDVWRMQNEIARHAPADARRALVVGGVVNGGDKVMSAREFEHNTGMSITARLPHDAITCGRANAAGKPEALTHPRSRIGRAYRKFARGFAPPAGDRSRRRAWRRRAD